jgi:recombination protein RecA
VASKLALVEGGGSYFPSPNTKLEFIPSGCTLLDCVLGGGWPLGRISNIVGDRSTSKTGLVMEACSNFAIKYPKGRILYRESEAAFDVDYAESMGMPVNRVEFAPPDKFFTVEDFFEDLSRILDDLAKSNIPALYALDSLDALSDRDELEREIDKGSYGAAKAKKLSELFRRLVQKIERTRVCLLIVSQVRDNIGVTFGQQYSRSGGRALDFYASLIVYLAKIKTLDRTIGGVKRATGITVRVKCTKNKISMPMRECDFDYEFGYGINSVKASLDWLKSVGKLTADDAKITLNKLTDDQFFDLQDRLNDTVPQIWQEIEDKFRPKRRKYT